MHRRACPKLRTHPCLLDSSTYILLGKLASRKGSLVNTKGATSSFFSSLRLIAIYGSSITALVAAKGPDRPLSMSVPSNTATYSYNESSNTMRPMYCCPQATAGCKDATTSMRLLKPRRWYMWL